MFSYSVFGIPPIWRTLYLAYSVFARARVCGVRGFANKPAASATSPDYKKNQVMSTSAGSSVSLTTLAAEKN